MSAKPKAETPLTLSISVKGEIVKSNFYDFRMMAETRITELNLDPKTDEEFEQAKQDEKDLKAFEDMVGEAEELALKDMDQVYVLIQGLRDLKGLSRTSRLELSRKSKANSEAIREGIVRDGIAALDAKCREFSEKIAQAIKGKKSLSKMQEAVTEAVDAINSNIGHNRKVFGNAMELHGSTVAYGENEFLTLNPESARVEMERRIERHIAAIREAELKAEAETLRKEAEDKARTEREAAKAAEPRRISTPPERTREAVATVEPLAEEPERPASKVAALPQGETAADELADFLATLTASFAPVKEARGNLRFPENIERAAAFATALGTAYKILKAK